MSEPPDDVDPDTGIDPDAAARALFVDDRELHRRLFGPSLGWKRFKATLKIWECEGCPRVNELTRTRFYPAVVEWLHAQYGRRGAHENFLAEEAQDGPENFGNGENNATTRESAGPQTRPGPQGRNATVVLDGETSRARPDGLSRLVHPPAARR
jgi:hypothetical protein